MPTDTTTNATTVVTPIAEPATGGSSASTSNLINTSSASRTSANSALAEHAGNMATLGYNLVPGANTNSNDPNNPNNPAYSDATTQALDRIAATSDAATKNLIASIQAQRQSKANALDTQYSNYKSGLQELGVSTGEAKATPQLLQGQIVQAENMHQAKLADIDMKLNKSLMDAQTAATNSDYKTLTEKNAYIKQLKAERGDTLKSLATALTEQKTIATDAAATIYNHLQTISPANKEKFILGIASQYGINADTLVGALKDYATKQAKSAKSLSPASAKDTNPVKFTPTDKKSLVNAGLPAKQILNIETYVNTYGVDAFIAANPNLTDKQKTALNGIFAPKAKSGGFGG